MLNLTDKDFRNFLALTPEQRRAFLDFLKLLPRENGYTVDRDYKPIGGGWQNERGGKKD